MDKTKYQLYINNFRRRLAQYLKPDIGLLCNVYPSDDGGAIIEFVIGINTANDDLYKESSKTLGSALSNIKQSAFGGTLEGFSFAGTNTILETNRIIYIKEADPSEWSDAAAEREVSALISNSQRASK